MNQDPYDYEIEIDRDRNPVRTTLVWILFVFIFVAIIGCAVWVFCISKRGLNFEPPHSKPDVEIEISPDSGEARPFVGVSLPVSTMRLNEGERTNLTAILKPAPGSHYMNVQGLSLRWESEHPGIASVDKHGEIVALHPGSTRITISVNDRRVDSNEAYCMILVMPTATRDTTDTPQDTLTKTPEP